MPLSTYVETQATKEKRVIFRAYQIIWYLLGLIETLLLFRFVFRFSAANPTSPFVQLVYQISAPLIAPFRNIYPTPSVEGVVFEWVTILAMIIWALIAYALVRLFQLIKPVKPEEVEQTVDNP